MKTREVFYVSGNHAKVLKYQRYTFARLYFKNRNVMERRFFILSGKFCIIFP